MASSENTDLRIDIVADGTQAKQAFSDVGKSATELKGLLDQLGQTTTSVSSQLKTLFDTANGFKKSEKRDIFGLGTTEKKLSNIASSSKSIASDFKNISKSINESFDGVAKKVTTLRSKFKNPINPFKIDDVTMNRIERIEKLLPQLAQDRRERRAMIAEELRLVQAQKALVQRQKGLDAERMKNQRRLTGLELTRLKAFGSTKAHTVYGGGNQDHLSAVKTNNQLLIRNAKYLEKLANSGRANGYTTGGRRTGAGRHRQAFGDETLLQTGIGLFAYNNAGALARRFYDEISHLQEKRARVSAWGLSQADQAAWGVQVDNLLKSNKFITRADAESMMMAAASSIGHYDPKIVGQTVAQVTKYAQMERAMGYNKSEIDDIAKNYYGVAEARQVADSVEKTLKTFETVFKITTTTSGKITVADVETILRNMGPGASTISDEGLLRLLAYAEQIKIAGRGSSGSTGAGISTVGTNVKMLQLMGMGKPSAINAKKQMAQLGVMEDGTYIRIGDTDEYKIAQDTSNTKNRKEQALARGLLGQATETVVIDGRKLAMAGVWNKELAQSDPVKWISSMTSLVQQFTAEAENRSEYYGHLSEGKENLSTEEFLKTLSTQQIYSAVQTFWAKTGLSQRVLTALTTFSNQSFQHRSEAMMKTAQHQMSVDDLMKMQIENGNLSLSFLALEKSTSRLVQAFEPLGVIIAKFAYQLSNGIDAITHWVNEWNGLAQATAMLLGYKAVKSAGSQVAYLYGYGRDNPINNAPLATNQNTGAKSGDKKNSFFVSLGTEMKNSVNGTKTILGNLLKWFGKKLMAVISGIGWAVLVADFASVLMEMAVEYTDWGKGFKDWFTRLADDISNTEIALNIRKFISGEKTDAKIADKQSRLDEIKRRETELHSGAGEYSVESLQELGSLKSERERIEAEINAYHKANKEAMQLQKQAFSGLKKALEESGAKELSDQIVDANEEIKRNDDYLKDAIAAYKMDDSEENRKQLEGAQKLVVDSIKKRDDLLGKLNEVLSAKGLSEHFEKVAKVMRQTGSDTVAKKLSEDLSAMLSDVIKSLGANVKANHLFVASRSDNKNLDASGRVLLGATAAAAGATANSENVAEATTLLNESKPANHNNSTKLTNVKQPDKPNKVFSEYEKLKYEYNRLLSQSQYRFEADSYEEAFALQEQKIRNDLAKGKYKDKQGKSIYPFLPKEKISTDLGILKPENFDLDAEYNGVKLREWVDKATIVELLRKFNETFKTMFKQANEAVSKTNLEVEKATQSITEVGAASYGNSNFKDFSRNLGEMRLRWEKSGVAKHKKKDIDRVLQLKGQEGFNIARVNLLEHQKRSNTAVEDFEKSNMTVKERRAFDHNRKKDVLNAQFNASVDEMRQATELAMYGKTEEEKNRIRQESYVAIETARKKHHEQMLALDQEFYRDQLGYDNLHIRQLVENWQSLGDQIKGIQTEMMEGFVEANEKWLDGDLDSWRDYTNNLLKMWRRMVLKAGYSQLLGSVTEGTTNVMHDFVAGAFNMDARKDEKGNDVKGTAYKAGNFIWSALGFGGDKENGDKGDKSNTDKALDGIDTKGFLNSMIDKVKSWFGGIFDNFDFSSVKDWFSSIDMSWLTDMFSSIGSVFSDLMGSFGGSSGGSGLMDGLMSVGSSVMSYFGFANGGIMTSKGALPLNMYANGGIANSAQVAVFGEGRQPEAYVPLPDGRTIPVTINGGGMGAESGMAGGNNINISINVTNNAGGDSSESANTTSDANEKATDMKKLANNIKSLVKQEIYNQSRPGGLLYNNR